MNDNKISVIAFAAHPDDVELSASGTVISLIKKGYKVAVVDLTQGELGTRGSLQIRKKEAEKSSKLMGLTKRINLKLKDGHLDANSQESINKIIKVIRKYKPDILLAPYFINDRHPDHIAAGMLVKKANFLSGLINYEKSKVNLPRHRAKKIFYYMQSYTFEPTFIYDISDVMEEKMQSILCFSSQFYNPNSKELQTFLSTPEFLDYIKAKSEFFGHSIRAKYGEPFYCEEKISYDFSDLLTNTL